MLKSKISAHEKISAVKRYYSVSIDGGSDIREAPWRLILLMK